MSLMRPGVVKQHMLNSNSFMFPDTSPPKTVLKDKYQNLIEARLAPMSVVYVGFEDKHGKSPEQDSIFSGTYGMLRKKYTETLLCQG